MMCAVRRLIGYAVPRARGMMRFDHRLINLHPSLLPAFGKGMHAVHDALEWGAKITGCTIHFATEDLDGGPIILQQSVPIEESDTEDQQEWHRLVEQDHPDAGLLLGFGAKADTLLL